jgi:hypothetical protein
MEIKEYIMITKKACNAHVIIPIGLPWVRIKLLKVNKNIQPEK